ncbi:hypothetical protein AGOR_G00245370 [Albula goreensis]|uniref:MADF domain-containing protein n=1 Tax=Albula goreensis TaxID=1534307 RepID=A0A8T3CGZ5_9TELE|nr:hypothetical protein AGOR_G00245370 [Albula goreensis]
MEGKEFWTRPKVEQLCKLWKTKASLYNPNNEYRGRWQKRRDSEEIAQELGTTVGELLKKMKNLRTQYGRERRKTSFSPNDNCHVSSSKWYLLSMLTFLDRSDDSILSGAEVVDEVTEGRLSLNQVTAVEEDEFPKQPRSSPPQAVTRKRARPADEDRSDVRNASRPPREDALDIFGKFVASELRLMENAQMQKLARLQIQQVLLDVQLGTVVSAPLHHEYSVSTSSTC